MKKERKIIESSDIAKQFAKLKKIKIERQYLQKRLSNVGQWLPLLFQIKKDFDAEELLGELHKRLSEIKKQEQKIHQGIPVWNPPGNPPVLGNPSPVYPGPFNFSPGWSQHGVFQGQIPEYHAPTILEGAIEYPTNFYAYKWAEPAAGWGNDNDFRWDLLRGANRQERQSGLRWIGDVDVAEAESCAFGAHLISTVDGSPYRRIDHMGDRLCFVYSFPELQHDSALTYSAQVVASVNGVGIWGGGNLSLELLVCHTNANRFEDFWPVETVGYTETEEWRTNWYWDLSGIMDAPAGSTASLTIGIGVYLMAQDPDIEAGIGYIGDMRGETYTGQTPAIDTNALWNDAQFSVRYDTGYTGPAVGRYKPGVRYKMEPF